MEGDQDITRMIWQRIHAAAQAGDVIQVLSEIDRLLAQGGLTLQAAYRARVDAFRALKELSIDDFAQGSHLVLEYLLPFCLSRAPGSASEASVETSQMRECLIEWINQYPEGQSQQLRDSALNRTRDSFERADPEPVCWTVSVLGFRRPDIEEALWRVVGREPEKAGDTALSTLAGLGLEPRRRQEALDLWLERAASRLTRPLIRTADILRDPAVLIPIYSHLQNSIAAGTWGFDHAIAVRAMVSVADHSTQTAVRRQVWQMITALGGLGASSIGLDILMGSDVASRCDSDEVIPTLIAGLAGLMGDDEPSAWRRHLLSLRMNECFRPAQLLGWQRAAPDSVIRSLEADVRKDTAYKGSMTTAGMSVKESVWRTLFCLGLPEIPSWFENCVATEANPFLRQQMTEILACFRVDPLPSTAIKWITEPLDMEADSSREWAAKMGAIQLARSSASHQAFDALCKFGLTHGGQVLQQSVDALVDVTIDLYREGDTSIVDALLETAESGTEARHRTAAAAAIERVAAAGLLRADHAQRLISLARQEDRTAYERGAVIAALGYLPCTDLDESCVADLREWGEQRSDWVGGRSLETLARRGLLSDDQRLMETRLGLKWTGAAYELLPGNQGQQGIGFIIGLLYQRDRARFGPVVATLIADSDYPTAIQVLHCVQSGIQSSDRIPVDHRVVQAVLNRIRRRQTSTMAELQLFEAAAIIAPDQLASERWNLWWYEWLPDARAALADALGYAKYLDQSAKAKAVTLLASLLGDSYHAVRRAAARAIAHQSNSPLGDLCRDWSGSTLLSDRRRAAEACTWLGSNEEDSWDLIRDRLAIDPEPSVRETMSRSQEERRLHQWAAEYTTTVIEARSDEDAREAWRYGNALAQIGDDESMRTLEAALAEHYLPPNQRYWKQTIIRAIENNWRKITQKWPEPWLAWRGTVEEGKATLHMKNGTEIVVTCSLWRLSGETPTAKHSWGGATWPIGMEHGSSAFDGELTLRLQDGRVGTASVSRISGGVAILTGAGAYPA